jgi:peptidoglycan hydrolase-like protein with peptidoglycan-binding domain
MGRTLHTRRGRASLALPTALLTVLLLLATAFSLQASAATAPPPAPAPPAGAPVPGRMNLVLQDVGGTPAFALDGRHIVVRGTVVPYVGGQRVKLSIYREGRKVGVRTVSVVAIGNGAGEFHVSYSSAATGVVQVRGAHYLTAQQAAFSARSPSVHFVSANVGPGAHGPSVRLLQSELDVLHYAVPLSGVFEEGTGRALVAYRKMTGLARVPLAGAQVFEFLKHGAGSFHVRYPQDGRHVEGDLTKQVLAEIEPGGRVHAIYTMSSGKPSTPTVIGHFNVYLKTPGTNSEGMVDSNYFIRGYAIHGYHEVPTYAASHGCLRVPIPDAPAIFSWVRTGNAVDVYNEGGGGSNHVRSNAGP